MEFKDINFKELANFPKMDKLELKFQEKADPAVLDILSNIGTAIALVYKKIPKPTKFPSILNIRGRVEIDKPVRIGNLKELEKYFASLEKTFNNLMLAVQSMPQPLIKLPKIEIPAQVKNDNPELMTLIEKLHDKLDNFQPRELKFPTKFEVSNFPPQMIPQPVTNINVNPLQGIVKVTSATIGTSLTQLPSYGQLPMRRSIIIFNNSSNTIYLGGSDVTTSTGVPVLTQSYSPSIDAGYNMILYGIASQAGNDVRVMEISSTTQTVGSSNT